MYHGIWAASFQRDMKLEGDKAGSHAELAVRDTPDRTAPHRRCAGLIHQRHPNQFKISPQRRNPRDEQDFPGDGTLRRRRRRRPAVQGLRRRTAPVSPACQHTAGAHNHQWRGLLEDEEITANYRVIAYDLPRHGKSDPPENTEWWTEEYKLSADHYANFIVAC